MKTIPKVLFVLLLIVLAIETAFLCVQFIITSISKEEAQRTIDYVEQLTRSDTVDIGSVPDNLQYFIKNDKGDEKRCVEIVDASIIDISDLVGLIGIETKVTEEISGEMKVSYDYIQLIIQREASNWRIVDFRIIP